MCVGLCLYLCVCVCVCEYITHDDLLSFVQRNSPGLSKIVIAGAGDASEALAQALQEKVLHIFSCPPFQNFNCILFLLFNSFCFHSSFVFTRVLFMS